MDRSKEDRYSRQCLFEPIGAEGQARLAGARAALIGCGALGTVIADRLVRAGVGHLRIADRDFVELDNLQRQTLFDEEHARLRMPKAKAAASSLEAVNSEVEIEALTLDVVPANIEDILRGCDLALDATDNLEARFLLNDACLKLDLPWVHGAAVGSCGQVMPVIPWETACYRCYLPGRPAEPLQGCDVLGVLGTVTGIIGDLQATYAIQYLSGNPMPAGVLTFVDVWDNEFLQFPVNRLDGCPACSGGEFSFLERKATSWSTSLCGRNAVQITPAEEKELDLDELLSDLARVGEVESNGYLLVFRTGDHELTIFPTGRAIIKGTTDEGVARSLYSRYIGL